MKGLVYKDFLAAKRVLRQLILMIAVFAALGIFTDTSFASMMVILLTLQLSVSVFAYDEQAHWDTYLQTMPIGRVMTVVSRYVFSLLIILIGMAAGVLLQLVQNAVQGRGFSTEDALTLGVIMLVAIVCTSIMIPAIYKFGSEKSRMIMILVYLVPFGALLLLMNSGILPEGYLNSIVDANLLSGVLIGIPVSLAFMALSCALSVRIYKKKEL